MMKRYSVLVLSLLVFALALAVPVAAHAQSGYTVKLAANADLGSFLVDGDGMTLYYFTRDEAGVSNCKGQCAVIWPVFHAAKISVPAGLDPADFATITREDGRKQTTFRGWPLYYFNKDAAPGDVKGHKVNNIWFVVGVK